MFKLKKILKKYDDLWEIVDFPELSLGYYYEEKVWPYIEPSGSRWHIKKKRPFIVVRSTRKHVYLVLLTSVKENIFPCDLDEAYGIGLELPRVYLRRCEIREKRCAWLREGSNVFKRRTSGSKCSIVVRISRNILARNSVLCGECEKDVFDEQVKFIVEEELQSWRQRSSESF